MTSPADDNVNIAGAAMAALVGQIDTEGKSIADRVSVADLWLILNLLIPVVQADLLSARARVIPAGLTPAERTVWLSPEVRTNITAGRKIVAIKEARTLTGMSLKESKDFVEKMQAALDKTGGWVW